MDATLNDDEDARLARALWQAQDCLMVESVQFSDGRVALLDVVYPPGWYGDTPRTPSVRVRSWTRAAELLRQLGDYDDATTCLCPMAHCECLYRGEPRTAWGGECGGDGRFGFVAVFDLQRDALDWVAFFLDSNPFASIEYRDGVLSAVTNLGDLYTFLADDPTTITITARPRDD